MGQLAFSKDIKIINILKLLTTADSSDLTSEVIDTKGFDSLCVVCTIGTMVASSTLAFHLKSSDAVTDEDTLDTGADVLGTLQSFTASDDDKLVFIDMVNLDDGKRYYQLVVDKNGSNNTDESAIAFLYNGNANPVTQALGTTAVGEGHALTTG